MLFWYVKAFTSMYEPASFCPICQAKNCQLTVFGLLMTFILILLKEPSLVCKAKRSQVWHKSFSDDIYFVPKFN